MRRGERPAPVKNFGARAIEPHHIVPTRGDRQAVGNLAVTSPNRIETELSSFFFAVTLFKLYALRLFGW